jgi:hypothetical protein
MTVMVDLDAWDWEVDKRMIADLREWKNQFEYIEEPYVSPDGEKIAAVVKPGEMEFSVCENGTVWDSTFDKVWYLRYAPDSRLAGIVSDTGAWTVAVDGEVWEETYDFVWNTQFSEDGKNIIVAAQTGMEYFAVTNGSPWDNKFSLMTNLAVSRNGNHTAASVQTIPISEGDIWSFRKGCFSVALDGKIWDRNFVNVWEVDISADGKHVAAEVRTSIYDFTIAVDGTPWPEIFQAVWKPKFSPVTTSVTAPVKKDGRWVLMKDGRQIWDRSFVQLWHHCYNADGTRIAAITAPKYGRWTMALDGVPWSLTFGDLVTDGVISADGRRVGCVGKENGKYSIAVDGIRWNDTFDMAWKPVFSSDSVHVAAKVEKNGRYFLIVDGKSFGQGFKSLWDPVFSPDGKKILVRGIEDGPDKEQYHRKVIKVSDILG